MKVGKKPASFFGSILPLRLTYPVITEDCMRLLRLNIIYVLAATPFDGLDGKIP